MLLGLAACGGGSKDAPGGLVLGVNLGVEPAAMVILEPQSNPDEAWKQTLVQAESDAVQCGYGATSSGESYLYDLDADGKPTGRPFRFERREGGWERAFAEGLGLADLGVSADEPAPRKRSYELAHGNVIQKALWFQPTQGAPGILTISGNLGCLDIWRRSGDTWKPETLWAATVGIDNQRLRDMEIGDVDGDKIPDIVIATHDQGQIWVVRQTPAGMVGERIYSEPQWAFVHEIELGDVDGDGLLEIFATPSEQNRMDGSLQTGIIVRLDFEAGAPEGQRYKATVVEQSSTTHAKEILCTDLDQDGQLELYSSMEGEAIADLGQSDEDKPGTFIKRYDFQGAQVVASDVTDLPGHLCRFLVSANLKGDGQRQLIASTSSEGIWSIAKEGGQWTKARLISGLVTKGFEHATIAYDWDGDGLDELYVVSDGLGRAMRFVWDKKMGRISRKPLADLSSLGSFFCWNIGVLPKGF